MVTTTLITLRGRELFAVILAGELVIAVALVALLAIAWGVRRQWRQRSAAPHRDAIAVTDREAEGLRSLAAADYAKFAQRRKGRPS